MSTTQQTATAIDREPNTYTANNSVRFDIKDNPIPNDWIGRCIREGELVSRAPNNPMNVTLRYREGTEVIQLKINLEDNKVFSLSTSYERDWQEDLDR